MTWPEPVLRLLREPDGDLAELPCYRLAREWEPGPEGLYLTPDTVVRAPRWAPLLLSHDAARVVGRAHILRDEEGILAALDLRRPSPPVNGLSWAIRYSAGDDGRLRLVLVEEVSLARVPANPAASLYRGFLGPFRKLGLL